MKAKSFMLFLAMLLIFPISEAATKKRGKKSRYKEVAKTEHAITRSPIDYTIEVTGDENSLQIIFHVSHA